MNEIIELVPLVKIYIWASLLLLGISFLIGIVYLIKTNSAMSDNDFETDDLSENISKIEQEQHRIFRRLNSAEKMLTVLQNQNTVVIRPSKIEHEFIKMIRVFHDGKQIAFNTSEIFDNKITDVVIDLHVRDYILSEQQIVNIVTKVFGFSGVTNITVFKASGYFNVSKNLL